MDCREVDELLGAYALHALDASEHAEVEAHLAGCALHEEALAFERTAARLSAAAPEREPPAALRERVLAIAATPRRVAPPPPVAIDERAEAQRAAWWRDVRVPYALAAAFAAIAIALGAWNVALRSAGGPDELLVRTSASGGVSSRLVYVPAEGVGTLTFEGLAPLAAEQDYQLWRIPPGGTPISHGVVSLPDGGGIALGVEGAFPAGTTFAVTVEPAGGSQQPTSSPILALEM